MIRAYQRSGKMGASQYSVSIEKESQTHTSEFHSKTTRTSGRVVTVLTNSMRWLEQKTAIWHT